MSQNVDIAKRGVDALCDLVAGSGIRFADRGEHKLKGVPDSWPLYAVTS
jgi:hypothetical protein